MTKMLWLLTGALLVTGQCCFTLAARNLAPNHPDSEARIRYLTKVPLARRANFSSKGWRYRNAGIALTVAALLSGYLAIELRA